MQEIKRYRTKSIIIKITITVLVFGAVFSLIIFNIAPTIRYNLATKYYRDGLFENAEELYQKLGDYRDSRLNRARILYRLSIRYYEYDLFTEARAYVDELMTICPGAQALHTDIDYRQALQYGIYKEYDEAEEVLEQLCGFANSESMLNAVRRGDKQALLDEKSAHQPTYNLGDIFNEAGNINDTDE